MSAPAPRWTIRRRLTVVHGVGYVVSGAAVTTMMLALVAWNLDQPRVAPFEPAGGTDVVVPPGAAAQRFLEAQEQLRHDTLTALTWQAALGLVVVGVLALGVGHLVTGRALAPLGRVTHTARRIAADHAHLGERIDLRGPHDEVRALADAFDEMVARLERSFEAQRSFVAAASHELRTPLATTRTLAEVALRHDDAAAGTRLLAARVLETTRRSQALVDRLLVLAESQDGLRERSPVDLAALAHEAVRQVAEEAAARGIAVERAVSTADGPVTAAGDEVLLGQVALNLVQNAVRHNHDGGSVCVEVGADAVSAHLRVRSSGDVVPPDRLAELTEPFNRLGRTRLAGGHGLGLAIVQSVVRAHDGALEIAAPPTGGLDVTVRLARPGP